MAFKRVIIRRVGPLSWLLGPMNQTFIEVCICLALIFIAIAVILATSLHVAITRNTKVSASMLTKGNPLSGPASWYTSLNVAYLLPWKRLPNGVQLSPDQRKLWRRAQLSSCIAILAVVAGATELLMAG